MADRSSIRDTFLVDRDAIRDFEGLTLFLAGKVDDDAGRVLALMTKHVGELFGDCPQVNCVDEAAVLMNAAGVVINAASIDSDVQALRSAETWMTTIVESRLLDGTRFESIAIYNLANSRISITDIESTHVSQQSEGAQRVGAIAAARFRDRERLRLARRELDIAASLSEGRDRGMRLCNLANTFDHSGRWIEAYDAYARALLADPENGNAAGNAAVLIERVIAAGWDFEGHLCSLYDHYLTLAKTNRAGTIAVAGEAAARRFDAMALLGSHEPFAFVGDEENTYQAWVARHRLALVASLEGLGSSTKKGRWDTIGLRSVTTSVDSHRPPTIFGVLNVLKADYLVARRLAFEADSLVDETGCLEQHDADPGAYTDTLDHAVYGEVSSKLVLAHRAALDVLDKTAVAVNEHLCVGDDPKKVSFRKFWFEGDGTELRSSLMRHAELATAILSMAELAIDMRRGGLYGHAQDVRNAGTHRFVVVHHGLAEVKTTETMQAMTMDEMRRTCHQSLTVARAAFLYMVAMLETFEANKARDRKAAVPLYLSEAR